MAGSMRADEAVFEDDGGFHDYTIATSLEKLIASIENALRHVITKDLPRLYEISSGSASGTHMPATYTAHLNHRLPFRSETYSLSLHLPSSTNQTNSPLDNDKDNNIDNSMHCSLGDQPNKLQEWFLPSPVIVISPDSYSGRVLDEEEAHTLLSAGAAALSHLKLPWAVHIPVHDALRDAYRGIAFFSGDSAGIFNNNLSSTSYTTSPNKNVVHIPGVSNYGAVVRLESDSLHSRSLPLSEFCTLTGQLKVLAARLRWHAPRAASLCTELATAAADALEATDAYHHNTGSHQHQEEDQNLAAAAEALTLSSSPTTASPSKTPLQQEKRTSTTSSEEPSKELSVRWEMRKSYLFPLSGGTYNHNNHHGRSSSTAGASGWETSSTHSQFSRSAAGGAGGRQDDGDDFELLIDTWDDDAVWRPWAAEDDPIERLEVDALWSLPLTTSTTSSATTSSIGSSLKNYHLIDAAIEVEIGTRSASGGGASGGGSSRSPIGPSSASTWRLAALRRDYQPDDGRRPLIQLQSVDQRRQFLRLQSVTELPLQLQQTPPTTENTKVSSSSFPFQPPHDALPGATSFSGMLNTLLDHTPFIINATDASQLTSDEWWLQQGNYVPPLTPSYIPQDAIRDVFQAVAMPPIWPGTGMLSEQLSTLEHVEENRMAAAVVMEAEAVVGKGAPLHSLISRLALHALRMGNPRAIAMLWTKFLRELRFAHWEVGVPLPRMTSEATGAEAEAATAETRLLNSNNSSDSIVDSKCCILHQKLQLLDHCIRAKMQQQAENKKEELGEKESKDDEDDEGYASATENSNETFITTATHNGGSYDLEGEKALHFLETLPPAAVHAELLAVGFASAVALLSRAPAAKLPAVVSQLEKVKELGNVWLRDHGFAVAATTAEEEATTAAAMLITPSASESNLSDTTASETDTEPHHQQQLFSSSSIASTSVSPAVHAMIHSGLSVPSMKTLVQILACVEQTIAAGQSLLQRLDYYSHVEATKQVVDAANLKQSSSSSKEDKEEFSTRAANALIIRALEHGSGSSLTSTSSKEVPFPNYGAVIELDAADFGILSTMATGEDQDSFLQEKDKEESRTKTWHVKPFWNEWCVSISKGDVRNPLHRLFVRQLPAELRVATVITSEMT